MKKNFHLIAACMVLTSCIFIVSCSDKLRREKNEKKGFENEEGYEKKDQMEQAIAFEIQRTKDPRLGNVPRQHLFNAFETVKNKSLFKREAGALPGIVWNERGPNNVGGRTRSILIDKNDPTGNTVWAGSVGGGLWKATNFTTASYSWSPIDDLFPNLAVTSIAQNPVNTNTIYFGTGEGFFNSDALQGGGIWKSTNDGATWTHLPATDVTGPGSLFAYIQKVVVKQVVDTEFLFVATRNGGVQRSRDGGATFTQVLSSVTAMDRAADIEIAKNGDLYASMGIFTPDGIYKSTDNGTTWTKLIITSPAPTGYYRVEIACAPSDSNVVYASFHNLATNDCLGISKTTDGGLLWLPLANPSNADGTIWTSAQAWYDMIIAVDPDDANHVMIGGLDLFITKDGGTTFTQASNWHPGPPQVVHADHHEIKFFKANNGKTYIYFGDDGGVFFSNDASINIPPIVKKDRGYNVTQFYQGAIGPVPGSDMFLAGAQDNGTQYFTAPGINTTAEVTGGDGAFCHIDDDHPNVQISQYVYNNYFITKDNWASYSTVSVGTDQGQFINPTDYDSRTNALYGGYSSNNYTLITDVGGSNTASTVPASTFGAKVSAVRVSPNTVSRVYFGTASGRIVRVDDADKPTRTFTNITTTIPQAGYVSELAVQDGDDNHIIYCLSNYGINSVWETKDGGTTWTSIEGSFTTDVPVRAVMFNPNDPDQAFIGTDIGVYSTDNLNGTSTVWGETNNGLARVSIQYLDYRKGSGTLLAVTHGRGVFTSTSLETPAVYFGAQQTLTETTTATTGCRKYTDVSVPVVLSQNPSAPVQVNVTIDSMFTTATGGQDYDILTSMPITFTSGSTQNVVLRIYDDAATESTEKLTLQLGIANGGSTNAKRGATYQNFITIADNDVIPEAAGGTVLFYSENWESGMGTWTGFNTGTATAPNAWTISTSCSNTISNQTAVIYNQTSNTCGYDNTKETTSIIYQTINATGKYNLSLQFDWTGVGEIGYDQGDVVYDTTMAPTPTWIVLDGANNLSGNPSVKHVVASLPEKVANRNFRIGFKWFNDPNTGDDPPFSVDNIQLFYNLPAQIQLTVDTPTASTNFTGALDLVHFYDASGNILATLKNNANIALGCVKLEVDRAGGGANVPFQTNNTSEYLCSKTYKITAPGAPAVGVDYSLTLYYTAGEINTWKTGTGHTEDEAAIVKVSGHSISEVTPTNQYSSDVTVSPSTKRTAFAGTNHAYTANFTSFSGFGLGVPTASALPITLTNFGGMLDRDKAVLTWNTSSEFNNKGFYLEKSYNARDFSSIAFVNGYGTSVMPHSYLYNDYDLNKSIMYYRLKQMDRDGGYTYSRIVQLQVNKDGSVKIFPNPFKNNIKVFFGENVRTAEVQLLSLNGSRLYSSRLQVNGQSSATVDLSRANIPRGDYILTLIFNDKKKQLKVMKE